MRNEIVEILPNAEHTLRQFDQLRLQILQALERGRKLAAVLGPQSTQVESPIEIARKSIDLSRLNLVVIGAEGNGKSTLINTIMGEDLSPREQHYPGTVAPTFLEYGPNTKAEFSVELESGKSSLCKDYEEFKQYLLQRFNPHNKKKIQGGMVRLNHAYLRQGLRLVDIPGVEGVSDLVNQIALDFIRQHAHAVIAVVRDREYGPLLRVLSDFVTNDRRLSAIVSNQTRDFWEEATTPKMIADQPGILVDKLAERDIKIYPERIFVLHLPSAYDLKTERPPKVDSLEHRAQYAAFMRFIWEYIRSNGFPTVLVDGANNATKALAELSSRTYVRRSVVSALLSGDDSVRAGILSDFETAASAARSSWLNVGSEVNATKLAAQYWDSVHAAVIDSRDAVQAEMNRIEKQVEVTAERVKKNNAADYHRQLQGVMNRALEKEQKTQSEAIGHCVDYYCEHANHMLEQLYDRVPVLAATVQNDRIRVTPQGLIAWKLGKMEPGDADKVMKYGSIGTGALVSGVVAKGIALVVLHVVAAPVALIFWGVVGGAAGGLGLFHLFRDGNRAAVLRELKNVREKVQVLDTSENGPVRLGWNGSVFAIATMVAQYLEQLIREVGALVRVSDQNVDQLQRQLEQIDGALNGIREIEMELQKIISSAENADQAGAA